jgi:hypothetical protein
VHIFVCLRLSCVSVLLIDVILVREIMAGAPCAFMIVKRVLICLTMIIITMVLFFSSLPSGGLFLHSRRSTTTLPILWNCEPCHNINGQVWTAQGVISLFHPDLLNFKHCHCKHHAVRLWELNYEDIEIIVCEVGSLCFKLC